METTRFIRRPFSVNGVRVTEQNMKEVATWCGGEIKMTPPQSAPAGDDGRRQFIKVKVYGAKTERQTEAHVGDWVMHNGQGFKVYTDNAKNKMFVTDSTEEKVSA